MKTFHETLKKFAIKNINWEKELAPLILVDKVYSMGKNFQMDLSIYADIEALLKNTQACINISEVLHTSKVSKYTFCC